MQGNPNDPRRNQEGYLDLTPYRAIGGTAEEARYKAVAKKFLYQYKNLENDLKTLTDEVSALEEQRDSITIKLDGMPHGTGLSDKTASLASKTVDLLMQVIELRSEVTDKRAEVIEVIRKVKDRTKSRILYLHFIKGATFEYIAVDIDKSWRHTHRLYADALIEVGKMLEK